MSALIQYVKDGNVVESYQPKANCLACFIGEAELRFATAMFKPHYALETASLPRYFDNAKALATYVENHRKATVSRPKILSIKSYPASGSLENQTFLEITNL
ncbi:MAG: hypothetical protein HUJ13_03920 [Hydrogenovibrio crunogenus]|nr:hypothetical protein [Hydrogenovibrio crunogenus]